MFDTLGSYLCSQRRHLVMLSLILVTLLVLTLFSLWFGEPGTIAYTVSLLNLLLTLAVLAIVTVVLWYCDRRDQPRQK